MATSYNRESPCRICQRVRDPQNCENKLCREWQAWFIDRWETMRRAVMAEANGPSIQGQTISVGGIKYRHPDHIRDYLVTDPCLRCPWADGLCPDICDTRQAWLAAKEGDNELETGSKRETEKI